MKDVNKRFLEACNFIVENKFAKSYADIAKRSGISVSMMTEIKKGRSMVGLETLQKLVDSFPTINPAYIQSGYGDLTNASRVERLFQFLKATDTSSDDFYKLTGIASGYLKNLNHIGPGEFSKIINSLPINFVWLETGEGEMLTKRNIINIPGDKSNGWQKSREFGKHYSQNEWQVDVMPLVDIEVNSKFITRHNDGEYIFQLPKFATNALDLEFNKNDMFVAFRNRGREMDDNSSASILEDDIAIGVLIWENGENENTVERTIVVGDIYVVVHSEKIFIRRFQAYETNSSTLIFDCRNSNKGIYPDLKMHVADIKKIFKIIKVERVVSDIK